jgi:rfaE bifunctional protein nucleotidyltransferase chain/domain
MLRTPDKVLDSEALARKVKEWKAQGEKVVFTNGCFDILHHGHADYLETAASLGQKLVVGVNTDRSVRELKGHGRPVNTADARARLLAALAFVDAVCLFDEDTPLELIHRVEPNVLVKGGDYSIETIVGADFVMQSGGDVHVIPLTEGYSTTSIIRKLNEKS